MILPGLSGSFLLLILGKYQFITGALRSPFEEGAFRSIVGFYLRMSHWNLEFQQNIEILLTAL